MHYAKKQFWVPAFKSGFAISCESNMRAGVHIPSRCLLSLQAADKGLEPWPSGLSLHALSCEVRSQCLQVTWLTVHNSQTLALPALSQLRLTLSLCRSYALAKLQIIQE